MEQRIPHARGGEPISGISAATIAGVFPTRVGVNRAGSDATGDGSRIPHARGGEPAAAVFRG